MFRQYNRSVNFRPADGMKVIIGGGANLYLRDGAFQLYAQTMANAGLGMLYEKYEALKAKLAAEGLFDASHKKPLPRFPRRVGAVSYTHLVGHAMCVGYRCAGGFFGNRPGGAAAFKAGGNRCKVSNGC